MYFCYAMKEEYYLKNEYLLVHSKTTPRTTSSLY